MAQPVGSRIGVISSSDIRYEGLLHNIDANNNTITLLNVRIYGTEGRKQGLDEVPPSDQVYEYIVFSGADIKDLTLYENQTPTNDPAIVSAAPGRNASSLPPAKNAPATSSQQANQALTPANASSSAGTIVSAGNAVATPSLPTSAPNQSANVPAVNIASQTNAASTMMHGNVNNMMNRNMPNNRMGTNVNTMRHGGNSNISGPMGSGGAGNMMGHRGMYDNNANMYYHNQPRRGGYGMMGGRYNTNTGGYHNNYNSYNNGGNNMHQGVHRYHRGGYGGRGMYSSGHYRRRPEGHTGQDFQPATGLQKEEFKEEFDFTKSREEFEKKKNEFEKAKEEARSHAKAYDKSSFFDNISCDQKDKDHPQRIDREEMKRADAETFGSDMVGSMRGFRRGRGGRGRFSRY